MYKWRDEGLVVMDFFPLGSHCYNKFRYSKCNSLACHCYNMMKNGKRASKSDEQFTPLDPHLFTLKIYLYSCFV